MGGKQRAAAKGIRSNLRSKANARSRSPRAGAEGEIFPWLISLGCLFSGLFIFLSSTVPALRESRDLQRAEKLYSEAVEAIRRQTHERRNFRLDLPFESEAILIALDDLGLTPEAAMSRFGIDASNESKMASPH